MMKSSIFGLILVTAILYAGVSSAQEKMVFSSFPDAPYIRAGQKIIKQAYKTLGMDVDFVTFPPKRALLESNSGDIDGELGRVDGISQNYKNLIKVSNVPVYFLEVSAFTKNKNLKINGWKSLAPYRVAYYSGSIAIQRHMQGLNVIPVNYLNQGFDMMSLGRADVLIAGTREGIVTIKRHHYSGFVPLKPPLAVIPVYHYVHTKHKKLIPRLDKVLQQMQADGTIQHIRETEIHAAL